VFRVASDELRARLEARMRRSVSSPLAFHPLISAGADELLSYGLLVVEAIDRRIADPGSGVAAVLEDGFISLLFELQPHTLGRALSRSDPTGRAARIRAVEHLVDRSLDRPVTIAHLAAVAGCSARSLQKTFSDLCGIGPLEYVRRRRLSAARRLLETAGRTSSVSDIATRTGFPHLARFASNYRTRYGELPSETLRRAAGQAARRVD
jgi:AraC-like DNA-binding protein